MRKLTFAVVTGVLVIAAARVYLAQEPTTNTRPSPVKPAAGDVEQMRKSITQLTTENERLRSKVADLERRLRNQSIRDRMMQEEQRAEDLEERLFSLAKEEANLQGQLEDVNERLRPENIEQLPIMGSLRPEEVRESTRLKLSNQQNRIQGQLQLLQQNRARLQSSISVSDMLLQNLRMQMQAASHP
jgi:DNA repair exonuclease SbcCD ATPase subunit